SNAVRLHQIMAADDFAELASDERFLAIHSGLNRSSRAVKKASPATKAKWAPEDGSVVIEMQNDNKGFSLSMKARNATRFGDFLSRNLDALYERFLDETNK
ncbi:plasmid partitioning protein RepB C-terminal domain-containing protein, partial [Rhizobium sp. SGZ-381]